MPKALEVAAFRASPGESFANRVAAFAKMFVGRGEPGASEIMRNVFDADYLLQHDLVFIGSPETVAAKLRAAAQSGVFNTFMGEFNFADLPEADLMRSIRLFGERVVPALRDYEPF
jgi:alkanesulfonate monooxygenase SsuD/methylene tetrahydromethanopterin reductase-like flavin-dependent oxidoreductase (luciferase family)